MCCSLFEARFDGSDEEEEGKGGTTVVFSVAWHPVLRRTVHVLVYQNHPVNLGSGPNAMLLHFPARPMSPENVVDTENAGRIAGDCVRALKPPQLVGKLAFREVYSFGGPVHVFESGIYTVVLAQSPRDIPAALQRVPANKRPAPNPEIFDWYAEFRPDWPVALCCFDSRAAARAKPMMWWYDPLDTTLGSLPAIDAHDGRPPRLDEQVAVNHWAVFGMNFTTTGSLVTDAGIHAMRRLKKVSYRDALTSLQQALLPTHVMGRRYLGEEPNGDFVVPMSAIADGNHGGIRRGILSA